MRKIIWLVVLLIMCSSAYSQNDNMWKQATLQYFKLNIQLLKSDAIGKELTDEEVWNYVSMLDDKYMKQYRQLIMQGPYENKDKIIAEKKLQYAQMVRKIKYFLELGKRPGCSIHAIKAKMKGSWAGFVVIKSGKPEYWLPL